jgi:hypothetical protein
MPPDCYRVAGAALAMSTSWPRERSAAHFADIADGPTLRAALAALPFVARGVHRIGVLGTTSKERRPCSSRRLSVPIS